MALSGPDKKSPVIVLFRNDRRIRDNRALAAAADTGKPIVTAFLFDEDHGRPAGGAWRWWMHHSLAALQNDIDRLGGSLLLRRGSTPDILDALIEQSGADTVFWNRRYDPAKIQIDKALKEGLRGRGIAAESFDGALLHEPSLVKTKTGGPYKVYTPFWRAVMSGGEPRNPLPAPKSLNAYVGDLASDRLSDWKLLPHHPDWAGGLRETWKPGEKGARAALEAFLEHALEGYAEGRDLPAEAATSRLSPHLAHGEITPFQIWHALKGARAPARDIERLRKELVWREFCYHLLFHNPALDQQNFNQEFDAFPWAGDKKPLAAWQTGQTGYPIVDAGMRQLWQTGWMHNRVRMIVASFLIKHLLIDWRDGEKWFWDTLVDADPASNPANWQWVAGSGADAAPYFRIFNPILQGEKFDADGRYVRQFVPELAKLPDRFLHKPWQASSAVLFDAGVKLGTTYPVPVVDHKRARERALVAYRKMRDRE